MALSGVASNLPSCQEHNGRGLQAHNLSTSKDGSAYHLIRPTAVYRTRSAGVSSTSAKPAPPMALSSGVGIER